MFCQIQRGVYCSSMMCSLNRFEGVIYVPCLLTAGGGSCSLPLITCAVCWEGPCLWVPVVLDALIRLGTCFGVMEAVVVRPPFAC